MRKASIWISLVCIVSAIIFLLPSCNSTSTTTATTSKTTSAASTTSQATTAVTTSTSDKPIYGGEFVFHWANDVTGFDPAVTIQMDCRAEYQVTDELIGENWAKGPAGTGETDWTVGFVGRMGLETGSLAESWELPDATTIIFNIRHGVKWQNKAPVNGREFTAADVVWNINRNMTTKSTYLYGAFLASLRPTAWEATDQYTVKVTVPKEGQGLWLIMLGDFMWMVPREVIDTYGDMTNWKNVVGTGPFILNDYVSGSSVTYKRNPDYWKEDPVHPGNKLPYVDSLKMLIIVDTSTQQSALRTGKIDRLDALEHEDAMQMMKYAPDLQYKKYLPASNPTLVGHLDKTELPFKDIKVRQALNMAINKQEIVKTYYSGDAELFSYPYQPSKSYTPFFTPLNDEPQIVQDIFKYDVAKAKALLAEAGYADGFSTSIDCLSGDQADYLSMIKGYLADINVTLEIIPHEAGVFLSMGRSKSYKEMMYKMQPIHGPFRLLSSRLESVDDAAYWETPYTRETYNWVNANLSNETAVAAKLKEFGTYELSQVWGVWLPNPYYHVMWWPWVKGYHGEVTLGWDNQTKYTQYIWVDMAQKKTLGY
jgi:peptide/nickel transport system substrate-binding protein